MLQLARGLFSMFKLLILLCKSLEFFISELLNVPYNLQNNKLTKFLVRLNKIESTIDFTFELENDNILSFLDILLINNNNKLELKVHHKSIYKMSIYIFTHMVTPK